MVVGRLTLANRPTKLRIVHRIYKNQPRLMVLQWTKSVND